MLDKQQTWIEKYRAALLETNPTRQLERIEEAYSAIQGHAEESRAQRFEKEALDDARLILRLLREESLGRASSPWL
ncbi:MAG: hypothetical protein DMG74_02320 [Acidobacteria bacterium]|nr:MAG: hypothetical protein DMG75_04060 [Acidobacteriota bacterium]PYX66850.1 MAG: hypothetical protein DMG74_02320 [Acidobacteriota bacterium]